MAFVGLFLRESPFVGGFLSLTLLQERDGRDSFSDERPDKPPPPLKGGLYVNSYTRRCAMIGLTGVLCAVALLACLVGGFVWGYISQGAALKAAAARERRRERERQARADARKSRA